MSTKKLAEYDQEHMSEGWGEPCTGSITLESDSPIKVKDKITTPESYLINLINNDGDVESFINEFFPNGKPQFKVELEDTPNEKKYIYNKVLVDGKQIAKVFRNKKDSGEVFEKELNS